MTSIYIDITYILLSIICLIHAKETIIEIKDIYNYENVIIENIKSEESLVLKFNEKYYDVSDLPKIRSDITVTSNVTFSGNLDGTVFDFKNKKDKFMVFSFLKNNSGNKVKFENIIFKNFGGDEDDSSNMIYINFESDENYLEFENCTFIDNDLTIKIEL
ncbi:hypothetical protein PIROE2DRAFT_5440 [Piromyces sp. E2]|nr:hypothetical protein PIROE2DRAFT_5440 [Piromyces sp. E2]|eukprot:OUM67173.1 hypothetical protein PIROE2DRAFT_5440 [Piromyces sp. E2]